MCMFALKCVKCYVLSVINLVELDVCKVFYFTKVTGWMLNLAEVQTTNALYTNESIHFNNRSPIWHEGPSSTLYPGRGSHSCFTTAFTASFLALGSTVLIRSGPLKKEEFPHTHILESISRRSRSELSEELSPPSR